MLVGHAGTRPLHLIRPDQKTEHTSLDTLNGTTHKEYVGWGTCQADELSRMPSMSKPHSTGTITTGRTGDSRRYDRRQVHRDTEGRTVGPLRKIVRALRLCATGLI